MGRRKFRLSIWKNLERKKYQKCSAISHKAITCNKPEPDVRELVVQLPLSAYLSATAPSFHVLCDRMRDSEIIYRNRWTCTGISNNVLQKNFLQLQYYSTLQFSLTTVLLLKLEAIGWINVHPSLQPR